MRTDGVTLCPRTNPTQPMPRRAHRWAAAGIARWIAGTMIALSGTAIAPRAANADITYTWHEDDETNVTGSLTVKSAAQSAGQFTLSDVVSFTFDIPSNSYGTVGSLVPNAIPISTTTAAPMGMGDLVSGAGNSLLTVDLNQNWNTPEKETWYIPPVK